MSLCPFWTEVFLGVAKRQASDYKVETSLLNSHNEGACGNIGTKKRVADGKIIQ